MVAAATLTLLIAACATWHALPGLEPTSTPAQGPLRVTLRDGQRYELADGLVAQDSLIGTEDLGLGLYKTRAVPITAIERVEVRTLSPSKSIVALLAAVVAVSVTINVAQPKCFPLCGAHFRSQQGW